MQNSPAFVGFYEQNAISPVNQDISDLEKHFQRRDSLFRALGIVPIFVQGRRILEFGPGSGHNALYTASLRPGFYALVEGNPRGAKETRERLGGIEGLKFEIDHCLFQDYRPESTFDIVWAEGCIPHQAQPAIILEHIARFVRAGGVLCVTTVSGVSYLSEILRRLFRDRFFPSLVGQDVFDQAEQLAPYYEAHLLNLRGRSRPVVDWILDNIVQPFQDRKVFGIPEVIRTLSEDFDVLGTSPRFLTDWRWYKEIVGQERGFNEKALDAYFQTNLNLLDYRFECPPHSTQFGTELEALGENAWEVMCRIEMGEEDAWRDFFTLMDALTGQIKGSAPAATRAILEAVELLKGDDPDMPLTEFPKWWGRGQQYLSSIRKM
ncbi:MAG: Methyltransferase domain-containing protein [Candidatus Kentron sp. G]|nr:MAG: Methyltransferase domain-containing protein [Candidatus Kentron sp. G]VFN00658.1 MAG: Methyltransferase domain-containing protein [Candidatus Kentron sp. G]VFN03235.1 MAG: Methyltransferase domain-containing protein [Candidatus Kentron sp. G]